MNNIYQNYLNILDKIKNTANKIGRNYNDIKVLVVSKTQNVDVLIDAINSGIPIFAENYAQEFRDKYKELVSYKAKLNKCEFHFIGHIQSNKIKYIVPNVTTIHTVDSFQLANAIDKYANKINKKIDILIQVNTSGEINKSGIAPVECVSFSQQLLQLKNLNLIGLMTIGTFSEDEKIIRKEFSLLAKCLVEINNKNSIVLKELSMGMSHDFEIAIEYGATMVRIGSAIFGERNYSKK